MGTCQQWTQPKAAWSVGVGRCRDPDGDRLAADPFVSCWSTKLGLIDGQLAKLTARVVEIVDVLGSLLALNRSAPYSTGIVCRNSARLGRLWPMNLLLLAYDRDDRFNRWLIKEPLDIDFAVEFLRDECEHLERVEAVAP